jgi:hypothetical protein
MKSRAITLGASVIALTLAGPGQATAGGLGDVGQKLPDTGIVPKVEVNAKVNIKVNTKAVNTKAVGVKDPTKAAAAVPSKGSLAADARGSDHPRATIEANRRSGEDRSQVVLNLDSRHGVSAYADQRRKGRLEIEGSGQAGRHGAQSTLTAFARHAGKVSAHGSARTGKAKQGRAERRIREHSRHLAGTDVLRSPGHKQHLTPLEAIGRQVGNPIQLSLLGWLIGLTGAGCLGVSRLVRRLNRTS